MGDLAANLLLVSDLRYQVDDRGANNLEYKKGAPASLPYETAALLPTDRSVHSQGIDSSDDAEIRRQVQAATKAQADFRGYMLLASLPIYMPLILQYDVAKPNSSWNWLERWSSSHFCEPHTQIKENF